MDGEDREAGRMCDPSWIGPGTRVAPRAAARELDRLGACGGRHRLRADELEGSTVEHGDLVAAGLGDANAEGVVVQHDEVWSLRTGLVDRVAHHSIDVDGGIAQDAAGAEAADGGDARVSQRQECQSIDLGGLAVGHVPVAALHGREYRRGVVQSWCGVYWPAS